ncbi:MAG: hypothetical protein KDJ87_05485, partial [Rhizobiaceae bacterium]|nr:hypothetical protein [Rhizobiaceae bacterium]
MSRHGIRSVLDGAKICSGYFMGKGGGARNMMLPPSRPAEKRSGTGNGPEMHGYLFHNLSYAINI